MKKIIASLLFACCVTAVAQEEWVAPKPPRTDLVCVEEELKSEPVASYRISGDCTLTDIKAVGEYRYGILQIKEEIKSFEKTEVIRKFRQGGFEYLKERKITLQRLVERPVQLVCHLDILEKKILDAKLVKTKVLDNGETLTYDEKLELVENKLPELGVYTHGKTVTYMSDYCPKEQP